MNLFVVLLVLVIHVVLTIVLRNIKNNIAAGIDLGYTGTFLAGYVLGWEWGAIFGILFRAINHFIPMEFDVGMVVSFPVNALVGLYGALVAFFGLPLVPFALVGVVLYAFFYFFMRILTFGDTNYVMMVIEFGGLVLVNFVFFRYFLF